MSSPPEWVWDPGRDEYYWYNYTEESYNYQSGFKIFKHQEILHPLDSTPNLSSIAPLSQRTDSSSTITPSNAVFHERPLSGESDLSGFSRLSLDSTASSYQHSGNNDQDQQVPYSSRTTTADYRSPNQYTSLENNAPSSAYSYYPPGPAPSSSHGTSIHYPYNGGQSWPHSTTPTYTFPPGDSEKLQEVGRAIEYGPSASATEPSLLYLGVQAHRRLKESPGDTERLDPNFVIRKPGRSFFRKGLVFKVLWPELAGDTTQNITIATGLGHDEKVYVKIRWFVVVREGNDCCTCLSIQTYGRRGVTDTKVKAHHAIIHTGTVPPQPLSSELPKGSWEAPMGDPIRVNPNRAWEKLDPLSRVNFLKIYTVEHNVKVKDFGHVHPDDEWKLVTQFNSHWGIPLDHPLPGAFKPRDPTGVQASVSAGSPESQHVQISPSSFPGNSTAGGQGVTPGPMPTISEHSAPSHSQRERRDSRSGGRPQGGRRRSQY